MKTKFLILLLLLLALPSFGQETVGGTGTGLDTTAGDARYVLQTNGVAKNVRLISSGNSLTALGNASGTQTHSWATNAYSITATNHTTFNLSGDAPTSGIDTWRKLIFSQDVGGGHLLTNGTTQIPVDLAGFATTIVTFNTVDGGSTVRVYSQSLSGSALYSTIEGAASTVARDSDYSVIYGYGNSIDTNSPYSGILGYGNAMSHHSLGSFLVSSGGILTGSNSLGVGYAVIVTNQFSGAIGPNARTTADYQLKLGAEDASMAVVIPGPLTVGGVAITGSGFPLAVDGNLGGYTLTNGFLIDTWQDIRRTVELKEEWWSVNASSVYGDFHWNKSGTTATASELTASPQDSGHPAVAQFSSTAATVADIELRSRGTVVIGGGPITIESSVRLNVLTASLTETNIVRIGLSDTGSSNNPANGVWFEMNTTNLNWMGCSSKAGTILKTATGITWASNRWDNLKIVINPNGTNAFFYIGTNNTAYVVAATNNTAASFPDTATQMFLFPMIFAKQGAPSATTSLVWSDFFRYRQSLTSSR